MAVVIGTGSFLLFFSLAVNVIALLVPYWWQSAVINKSNGLWGSCQCSWRYTDIKDAFEEKEEAWFRSVQWLYAAGVALMAFALFLLFVVSCCSEKAYSKSMTAAGALMLLAALCVAVALIVFGVMGNKKWNLSMDGGLTGLGARYDWAMWLGVAGFGIALITSIVFLIQGSRH